MENSPSNREFVRLLKKGDMVAFDALYNNYAYKLHEFVLRYLKQEADAEEIVQEVFIKIWESRERIDIYQSFEAFLFTIAYNTSMSLLRKRLSETKSREYLKSLQSAGYVENGIEELQYRELNQQVQALLQKLTPR